MKLRVLLGTMAVLAVVTTANADPTRFGINHLTVGDGGLVEDFSIANYEFGSTDWIDFLDDGLPATFNIEVNSGPSVRPDFEYEVTLNYANYDIGFFGPGTVDVSLLGIKDTSSSNPIVDVFVKDEQGNAFGQWNTDGFNIFANYTTDDVLAINRGVVTIQWTQVPEPATFSLLGMAGIGLLLLRRR